MFSILALTNIWRFLVVYVLQSWEWICQLPIWALLSWVAGLLCQLLQVHSLVNYTAWHVTPTVWIKQYSSIEPWTGTTFHFEEVWCKCGRSHGLVFCWLWVTMGYFGEDCWHCLVFVDVNCWYVVVIAFFFFKLSF